MPLADRFSVLGRRPAWATEMWSTFEELVLDVIVRAYHRLMLSGRLRITWTENRFSRALLFFVDQIGEEEERPFFAHDEARILDDADPGALDENPDEAVRIDLAVRHNGMPRAIYYGIEAKVLTTQTIGSRRPGKSVSDYVDEGVARFACGAYAAGHESAAMVGFVIAGDAAALVDAINTALGTTCRRLLATAPAIQGFTDHYSSEHDCPAGPILLHHLFLRVWS